MLLNKPGLLTYEDRRKFNGDVLFDLDNTIFISRLPCYLRAIEIISQRRKDL